MAANEREMTEMALYLSNFTAWQKESDKIGRSKNWLAHIGKSGRCGDVLHLSPAHCTAPKFVIAGQYTEGGTNYWNSPEEFNLAMQDAIMARFPELAAAAVAVLERKAADALIKAEVEVAAIQDAITDAKR